ncbi:CaiB/BaiF CoA transferase family protein [Nonomuraea sp. CA-218870]|uniref:CaiB/BaiF CoA transferase family protein n=1 Tax=Nonomuraea sp. CA-218870 TaxID=3239998 RepID=UPI003D9009F9
MSVDTPADEGGRPSNGSLEGLRVVEVATMLAAPFSGMLLADHGADVVKVEMPEVGDGIRQWGHKKDDIALYWKVLARNKRTVTLDLHEEAGRDRLRRLLADADVLIENFRPGTLERWGLSPDGLRAANERLVVLRVSGWGQDGPYAERPGFGTLVEAFSGFAHINGWPDRPPTLPPFGLADSMAGMIGAFGILCALRERDRSGRGQVIDLALYEPMLAALGSLVIDYDQQGIVQDRMGNRTPFSAPRNAYQGKDGGWFAISASNQNTATRLLTTIGRPELLDDPRFATNTVRTAHQDELDEVISSWAELRTRDDAIAELNAGGVPVAPVNSVADIVGNEHVVARGSLIRVPDDELGEVLVQAPVPRLCDTPGRVRFLGRPLGSDDDQWTGGLWR